MEEKSNIFKCDKDIYEAVSSDPVKENDCIDSANIGVIFQAGFFWINKETEQAFFCVNAAEKAAVWKQIT